MRRKYLFWGDVAIFYLSLFLTLLIRYGWNQNYVFNLSIHLVPFSIIFAVWLLVFYITNLYEIESAKNNYSFFSTLIYSLITDTLIAIIFFYFIKFFRITPRANLFILLFIETVLIFSWRFYFNYLTAKRNIRNNTLIIGLSPQSQDLYDYLLANPQLGYNALGIIDIQHNMAPEVLGKMVGEKNIKTLVLGPSAYKVPRIINILYGLVGQGVIFFNLSGFYENITGKVPLGVIDQAWFLDNLTEGSKRAYEFGKRVFDLILALAIGLIFLPFSPFVILAIKLDTEGGIFYRQDRVGKAGKVFTVIKFRTMLENIEKKTGPVWASENDSRTTRVGKFIRRLRIDEIPQIWNVILDEMSFVGPRPERPEFHKGLKEEIPFYEERYLIKPGLTGWAQTKYKLDFRGGMTIKDIAEKVQYDLYYIKNRSLLLDAGIILKTINIILRKFI